MSEERKKPLTEVFEPLIYAIGHFFSGYSGTTGPDYDPKNPHLQIHDRGYVDGWDYFQWSHPNEVSKENEHQRPTLNLYTEGGKPTIEVFRNDDDWEYGHARGRMVLRYITANGVEGLTYGDESVLKSEVLKTTEAEYDNLGNDEEVTVKYGDLFGKSEGHEHTEEHSAGGSVSITVESTQSIEGVAEFGESVTAEVHTEFSESDTQSSETSREDSAEEETKVAPHTKVKITETLSKQDVVQDVTAKGKFTFVIQVGGWGHKHHGSHDHWRQWFEFESLEQLLDIIENYEESPDNWPLVAELKQLAPPGSKETLKAVAANIPSELAYKVKFEGKVVRSYKVEKIAG